MRNAISQLSSWSLPFDFSIVSYVFIILMRFQEKRNMFLVDSCHSIMYFFHIYVFTISQIKPEVCFAFKCSKEQYLQVSLFNTLFHLAILL